MKDYYSLLGLNSKASKAEIKKNYRRLANLYHPDKNKEPGADAKFIAITEAYDVLSNKKSRANYDLHRWNELKQQKASKEQFTAVVPSYESTRSRRNKKQKKRSINYHKEKEGVYKHALLYLESLRIIGRYTLHIIGSTILIVILISAFSQLGKIFAENILRGLIVGLAIGGIFYLLYWLINNLIQELKKDVEFYSIYYRLPKKKAINIVWFSLFVLLALYILFLNIYF